jgi:hypothetical protein
MAMKGNMKFGMKKLMQGNARKGSAGKSAGIVPTMSQMKSGGRMGGGKRPGVSMGNIATMVKRGSGF